jgi:type IV secretory pathway VirB10-like protein
MMKRSMIASGVLHAVVIVAATVAWPHAIEQSDEIPSVVPVDLVTIADVTNIAPSVQETSKPETPPEQPTPAQPQAAPPPPPQAEVAPPEPDKAPPPKEAEQKNASAPPNPVRPRRKPAPDQKFDVDTVIALLDKRAPKPVAPTPNAKPAETTVKGLGAQDAFTMDLKDALLAQMRECWNVPVGAPNPEQLIVQVRVFLAQDGSLAQPPLLEPASRSAAAGSPYMRTAAEAALRAVSVCEPYKRLPLNKYDEWREIVMTFDPSKMIGR